MNLVFNLNNLIPYEMKTLSRSLPPSSLAKRGNRGAWQDVLRILPWGCYPSDCSAPVKNCTHFWSLFFLKKEHVICIQGMSRSGTHGFLWGCCLLFPSMYLASRKNPHQKLLSLINGSWKCWQMRLVVCQKPRWFCMFLCIVYSKGAQTTDTGIVVPWSSRKTVEVSFPTPTPISWYQKPDCHHRTSTVQRDASFPTAHRADKYRWRARL